MLFYTSIHLATALACLLVSHCWHCSLHLSSYGAERFEDGASQINKSDMFYGDDGDISDDDLRHMDEVTMKNVQFVKMSEGDVVLLDNYKCMHGRNVFDGTRKEVVCS